jgi:hypothetical protein
MLYTVELKKVLRFYSRSDTQCALVKQLLLLFGSRGYVMLVCSTCTPIVRSRNAEGVSAVSSQHTLSSLCYVDMCDTYERCTVIVYSFDALHCCAFTVHVLTAA